MIVCPKPAKRLTGDYLVRFRSGKYKIKRQCAIGRCDRVIGRGPISELDFSFSLIKQFLRDWSVTNYQTVFGREVDFS